MEERPSARCESREIVDSADSSGSPGESGTVRESARASLGERAGYEQVQENVHLQ